MSPAARRKFLYSLLDHRPNRRCVAWLQLYALSRDLSIEYPALPRRLSTVGCAQSSAPANAARIASRRSSSFKARQEL
jgi:hypothetical protein